MKEITVYVCEECNKEHYIKKNAIQCEREHIRNRKLANKNYEERVLEIIDNLYYFKAESPDDLLECVDRYFDNAHWYSKADIYKRNYPAVFTLSVNESYANEDLGCVVVINELDKVLEKIGNILIEESDE